MTIDATVVAFNFGHVNSHSCLCVTSNETLSRSLKEISLLFLPVTPYLIANRALSIHLDQFDQDLHQESMVQLIFQVQNSRMPS
ncbi:hypothetical protein HanIR_Chr02g0062461 [Helianthus annuus]|nr:hypothetical protein HanIR_Chr02g0062461 [Helianthus annuus]